MKAPEGKLWVCLACSRYSKDRDKLDNACKDQAKLFDIENLLIAGRGIVEIKHG